MKLVNREELKAKLDRGEQLKLVMTLPEADFELKHIPGSICVHSAADAARLLKTGDRIVVYGSCPECPASETAARLLEKYGYRDVWNYVGGVVDWEAAGYPLEGAWAHETNTRVPPHPNTAASDLTG